MATHRWSRTTRLIKAVTLGALAMVPMSASATPANTYTEYTVTSGDAPMSGGEPSIGYDTVRDAAMYGAGLNVKRLTWNDAVSPPAMTVTDARPTTASLTTLDAITATDPFTGRTFNTQLAALCSLSSLSDDAGATWTPDQGCGSDTLLDHESIGGGPFHAPVPSLPAPAYPDAVYYCAQNGFNASCATSFDGGETFGQGVYITNTPANDPNDPDPTVAAEGGACVGLHGHIKVAPDGTVFVPLPGCGGQPTTNDGTNYEYWGGRPAMSISTDNGATWTIHTIPAANVPDGLGGTNPVGTQDEADPTVSIGSGGAVYFAWQNGTDPSDLQNGTTSQAMVAVSHDDGATWSSPVDISSVLGLKNVQFPEMIAGDDNRAAVAYLGTSAVGDDQTNAFPKNPGWDLYIATTYDGGKTWSTVDTTPNAPMQRGCIDMQGTTIPPSSRADVCNQRNLLDFNDITMDKQGRVIVAYSSGCNAACQANPASGSSGAVDKVMRQTSGTFLIASPAANTPEAPLAALLPVTGFGALLLLRRRRRARLGPPV